MGRGQVGGALPPPPRLGEGLQQAQFLHQTGLESSSIGGEEEWLDFGRNRSEEWRMGAGVATG